MFDESAAEIVKYDPVSQRAFIVNGKVVFIDSDGNYLGEAPAGDLPDMLTYDKTGKLVLVANEGQPSDDYTVGPEGLDFVPAHKSPTKTPLLIVGNEVSGTTTVWEISVND